MRTALLAIALAASILACSSQRVRIDLPASGREPVPFILEPGGSAEFELAFSRAGQLHVWLDGNRGTPDLTLLPAGADGSDDAPAATRSGIRLGETNLVYTRIDVAAGTTLVARISSPDRRVAGAMKLSSRLAQDDDEGRRVAQEVVALLDQDAGAGAELSDLLSRIDGAPGEATDPTCHAARRKLVDHCLISPGEETAVGWSRQPRVAARALQAVIDHQKRVLPPRHPLMVEAMVRLGELQMELGEPVAETRALFASALTASGRTLPKQHPLTMRARKGLAEASMAAGDLDQAAEQLTTLLRQQSRVLPADHPDLLATRAALARLEEKRAGAQ